MAESLPDLPSDVLGEIIAALPFWESPYPRSLLVADGSSVLRPFQKVEDKKYYYGREALDVVLVCRQWAYELVPRARRNVSRLQFHLIEGPWIDTFGVTDKKVTFLDKLARSSQFGSAEEVVFSDDGYAGLNSFLPAISQLAPKARRLYVLQSSAYMSSLDEKLVLPYDTWLQGLSEVTVLAFFQAKLEEKPDALEATRRSLRFFVTRCPRLVRFRVLQLGHELALDLGLPERRQGIVEYTTPLRSWHLTRSLALTMRLNVAAPDSFFRALDVALTLGDSAFVHELSLVSPRPPRSILASLRVDYTSVTLNLTLAILEAHVAAILTGLVLVEEIIEAVCPVWRGGIDELSVVHFILALLRRPDLRLPVGHALNGEMTERRAREISFRHALPRLLVALPPASGVELLSLLSSSFPDINVSTQLSSSSSSYLAETPLVDLVRSNNIPVLDALLQRYPSLLEVAADYEGMPRDLDHSMTLLACAVKSGRFELFEALLAHKPDLKRKVGGTSYLALAVTGSDSRIILALIDSLQFDLHAPSSSGHKSVLLELAASAPLEVLRKVSASVAADSVDAFVRALVTNSPALLNSEFAPFLRAFLCEKPLCAPNAFGEVGAKDEGFGLLHLLTLALYWDRNFGLSRKVALLDVVLATVSVLLDAGVDPTLVSSKDHLTALDILSQYHDLSDAICSSFRSPLPPSLHTKKTVHGLFASFSTLGRSYSYSNYSYSSYSSTWDSPSYSTTTTSTTAAYTAASPPAQTTVDNGDDNIWGSASLSGDLSSSFTPN